MTIFGSVMGMEQGLLHSTSSLEGTRQFILAPSMVYYKAALSSP